ncbi:MAG: hypothetical protein KF841_11215 [Phycisphaerae bacterium]|nr:hypothetical protein [Phycisphaerae bacterium]
MTTKAGPDAAGRFSSALGSMVHGPDFGSTTLVNGPHLFAGYAGYAAYPIRVFGGGAGASVYFEGRIYNKTEAQAEQELLALADRVLAEPDGADGMLSRWIRDSEGEYVVAMFDSSGRTAAVFGDPLARLALFHHSADGAFLLARECKFVQRLKADPAFDRVGWAEILTFNHLLGRRTLYEGVRSGPTGALFVCHNDGTRVRARSTSLYMTNLDDKDPPGRSSTDYARELVDLWRERCGPWGQCAGVSRNVISLSGGKDSRIVAAILSDLKLPYTATTYIDVHRDASADAKCAEGLAHAIGFDWRLLKIPAPSQAQVDFLVRATDGINPVANARMLPYLEMIVGEFGRSAMYITGDGGDYIFPDLRLGSRVRSLDDVARAFLGFNPAATPAAVSEEMMGLSRGTLEGELRDLLASYPEKQVMQKAIHYRGFERGQNWVYGGEERARFFLWESSPHYLFRIFERSMRIPDEVKSDDALYIEFLRALSPRWVELPEANYGLPLSSPLRSRKMKLKSFAFGLPLPLREAVRFVLKGRRRPYVPPTDVAASIHEQLSKQSGLGGIMNADAVRRRLPRMSRHEFENFRTLVVLERLMNSTGAFG